MNRLAAMPVGCCSIRMHGLHWPPQGNFLNAVGLDVCARHDITSDACEGVEALGCMLCWHVIRWRRNWRPDSIQKYLWHVSIVVLLANMTDGSSIQPSQRKQHDGCLPALDLEILHRGIYHLCLCPWLLTSGATKQHSNCCEMSRACASVVSEP